MSEQWIIWFLLFVALGLAVALTGALIVVLKMNPTGCDDCNQHVERHDVDRGRCEDAGGYVDGQVEQADSLSEYADGQVSDGHNSRYTVSTDFCSAEECCDEEHGDDLSENTERGCCHGLDLSRGGGAV